VSLKAAKKDIGGAGLFARWFNVLHPNPPLAA